MGRAPCCEKVGLKKGRWTAEEDEVLTRYILANGEGSWRSLPKNAGRTDNEVKNYWNSHLSRNIYSFKQYKNDDSLPITMNITKVAGPYKGRGGRKSRSSMKKHKATLMSLGKPKSPKAIAHEVLEPISKETAAISLEGTDSALKSLATEGPHEKELENGRKIDVQESSIDSAQRINAAEISHSHSNEEKETEDFGPYEWLDSEIKRLCQSQLVEPSGSNTVVTFERHDEVPDTSEEKVHRNGVMRQQRVPIHYQERRSSSNGCSSNEESNGEWYNRFSPANSRFDEEWLDWNWTAGGDLGPWGLLLDEDDNVFSSVSGSENREGEQGCD
ncbi:unnamed protein product [Dovyalis caffra]|uniref:Uncharacterized protein n=1 Tax=Dovyalis caffra TaxID=77055 RepID=A0AAV1R1I2_9ROSI|nr:unnamed protein product [Dovyalis caffra]